MSISYNRVNNLFLRKDVYLIEFRWFMKQVFLKGSTRVSRDSELLEVWFDDNSASSFWRSDVRISESKNSEIHHGGNDQSKCSCSCASRIVIVFVMMFIMSVSVSVIVVMRIVTVAICVIVVMGIVIVTIPIVRMMFIMAMVVGFVTFMMFFMIMIIFLTNLKGDSYIHPINYTTRFFWREKKTKTIPVSACLAYRSALAMVATNNILSNFIWN